MEISQALARRSPNFEGIHSCRVTDTFGDILRVISKETVHRYSSSTLILDFLIYLIKRHTISFILSFIRSIKLQLFYSFDRLIKCHTPSFIPSFLPSFIHSFIHFNFQLYNQTSHSSPLISPLISSNYSDLWLLTLTIL